MKQSKRRIPVEFDCCKPPSGSVGRTDEVSVEVPVEVSIEAPVEAPVEVSVKNVTIKNVPVENITI